MSSITYKPHVDGLRAVAVLSVLFFHIDSSLLPGGFVGVDVFFVISGYLITSIIHKELLAKSFSIKSFYERRIKRILPVYFTVSITSLLCGCILFFPSDLLALAESAIASASFLSNFYFWSTSGYFSNSTELKPLVHTWSLAVEEQFYVFWPIMFVALAQLVREHLLSLTVFTLIIFGVLLSVFLSNRLPDFSYYSIFTRAFELMIGGYFAVNKKLQRRNNPILAVISLALLALSFWFVNKSMAFPGYIALVPCLATACIIVYGKQVRIINCLLSNKVSVYIGQMSYSLYMWHWPVLAFTRYYFFELDWIILTYSVLTIFVLSWLSRTYIEKPFVGLRIGFRKVLISFLIVPFSLVLLVSIFLINTNGWDARYNQAEQKLIFSSTKINDTCNRELPLLAAKDGCVFNAESLGPKIAIWGDSHANHLTLMAESLSKSLDATFEVVSFAGCPAIVGVYRINRSYSQYCFDHNRLMMDRIDSKEFDLVILSSNWANYTRADNLADDIDRSISIDNSKRAFYANLEKQMIHLTKTQQKVIIINSLPNFLDDPVRCELTNKFFERNNDCQIDLSKNSNERNVFDRFLKVYDTNPRFKVLNFKDIVCASSYSCSALKDGKILFSDKNHLSVAGSEYLTPFVEQEIRSHLP
mgnify:CR=1 FL=1